MAEIIYKNLRAEMARQNVTVRELARDIDVSTVTMSKRVNGHLDFKLAEARAVARRLSCDFDYLFSVDEGK